MARDYKRAKAPAPRPGPFGWLPFVAGLAIGLVVALGIYLRGPAAPPARDVAGAAPASEPAAHPAVPPDVAAPPKPRFDFYTILPEMEVKVPDWKLPVPEQQVEETMAAGAYVIQVGSFQRFEEADRAKAELALRGITANIERVVINGEDIWFRVRIGPISDLDALATMRNRLIEAGMDFMLLRIKDASVPGAT
ncbi:MAG: SPOR domain-containing protein [Gammaproteobacteria bacterium]|nr:SPOR domain-containing protein [Gammaproteobacteria bacterium]